MTGASGNSVATSDSGDDPGHYELRDERGLVGVYWCAPGQPPSCMVRLGAGRVPLLGQAIAAYLGGEDQVGSDQVRTNLDEDSE
jgi:hypothetical protein